MAAEARAALARLRDETARSGDAGSRLTDQDSAGELASAFDTLGWNPSNGSGNPFGQPLPYSQTLAGGQPQPFDPSFYGYMTYASEEPVTFASSGYEYSSNEQSIIGQ